MKRLMTFLHLDEARGTCRRQTGSMASCRSRNNKRKPCSYTIERTFKGTELAPLTLMPYRINFWIYFKQLYRPALDETLYAIRARYGHRGARRIVAAIYFNISILSVGFLMTVENIASWYVIKLAKCNHQWYSTVMLGLTSCRWRYLWMP